MKTSASWAPAPNLNVRAVQAGEMGWTVAIEALYRLDVRSVARHRGRVIAPTGERSEIYPLREHRLPFRPGFIEGVPE